MGVNPFSFSRFMDPQHYMNQWSATKNRTYLAGARLLARLEHERDIARGVGGKSQKEWEEGEDESATQAIPNKRVTAKGMEKESMRAGGGAGKRKSANTPDAADVAIDTTKRAKTDVAGGWKGKKSDFLIQLLH